MYQALGCGRGLAASAKRGAAAAIQAPAIATPIQSLSHEAPLPENYKPLR